MNILIAEDDDISRDLLHRILEREADCALTMAEDGEKAWALLNDPAQHFDVGIFDLMMPRLTGLVLVERIRATPALKGLPIILCTAVKDRATVEKASALGISHYVVKPYNRARILEKLQVVRAQVAQKAELENARLVAARLGVNEAALVELISGLVRKVEIWLATVRQSRTTADFQRDAPAARAFRGACLRLGLNNLHRELESIEGVLLNDFAAPERAPGPPSPEEIAGKLGPVATELARIQGRPKPAG